MNAPTLRLSPAELHMALSAQRATAAGFPNLAEGIAALLRRDLARRRQDDEAAEVITEGRPFPRGPVNPHD